MAKTVAVMQPYFFPYAGYFSLMRAVDHFVLFDCVQFPRRGWVHRNCAPGPGGREQWLTLPLARQPRDILICDLTFAEDADASLAKRLRAVGWLSKATGEAGRSLAVELSAPLSTPVAFLASSLRTCAALLGIKTQVSLSSSLALDAGLRGQDRVIAAAKAVGGSRYVNSAGGRELYAAEAFEAQGLELSFMRPYQGPRWSILYRLCTDGPDVVASEIAANGDVSH